MLTNLVVELKKKRITYSALAEYLSLSNNCVTQKINGKREFKADEMFAIQKKFFPEFSIDYLFRK